MTIFGWFNKNAAGRGAEPDSSGLSRIESTRPVVGTRDVKEPATGNAQPANRKSERMARRELLYSVVRESMTRAGVLSASYKFKVLSLDARARQFLVMVDLAPAPGLDTPRFGEVEAMIAQGAKNRYDIIVTAVYWRLHGHVAVGTAGLAAPATGTASPGLATSASAALPKPRVATGPGSNAAPTLPQQSAAPAARVAADDMAAVDASVRPTRSNADEVAEFRRALAAGLGRPAATGAAVTRPGAGDAAAPGARSFDGAQVHGPQSYTLLTGFEDTELGDSKVKLRSLSGSQFGDLN